MTWTTSTIRHADGDIHYRDNQVDAPAIIACHGFSDSGECWIPILETPLDRGSLATRYRWLLLDAVGHGKSSVYEGDDTAARQASDIATAIAALELTRPGLLGHSMGASAAASFAAARPDLCGFVMLEDPPWREPVKGGDARRAAFRVWLEHLRDKPIADLVAQCQQQNPGWPEAELEPWARSKLEFRFPRNGAPRPSYPSVPRRIDCPTLVMTGSEAKGAMTPIETAAELVRDQPGSEHVHFESAGHNIRREAPDEFAAAVARFAAAQLG